MSVTEDKVREIPGAVSRSFSGGSGMRKWSGDAIACGFCGTRRADRRLTTNPGRKKQAALETPTSISTSALPVLFLSTLQYINYSPTSHQV